MLVHVLHHGHCLDGIASAAIFSAFFRRHVEPGAQMVFIPKAHAPGDPFEPSDFEADEVACVDFRYTTDPRLGWWFDHHHSAFQLPGQREHFEADRSGRKFFDPTARSCTGFLARTVAERFGFDSSGHDDLLHWAERVDSASFPDPRTPVLLEEPALRLTAFAEHNGDRSLLPRLVDDLLSKPLADVAACDYVRAGLGPVLAQHREDIELFRTRCHDREGVVEYDLLDQPPRIYNKFIAYHHHPDTRYVVGVNTGPDGLPKLTAGYNPWLPKPQREHNIADLCERFGGGGHPFVGGVTFGAGDHDAARAAQVWIAGVLRGQTKP